MPLGGCASPLCALHPPPPSIPRTRCGQCCTLLRPACWACPCPCGRVVIALSSNEADHRSEALPLGHVLVHTAVPRVRRATESVRRRRLEHPAAPAHLQAPPAAPATLPRQQHALTHNRTRQEQQYQYSSTCTRVPGTVRSTRFRKRRASIACCYGTHYYVNLNGCAQKSGTPGSASFSAVSSDSGTGTWALHLGRVRLIQVQQMQSSNDPAGSQANRNNFARPQNEA